MEDINPRWAENNQANNNKESITKMPTVNFGFAFVTNSLLAIDQQTRDTGKIKRFLEKEKFPRRFNLGKYNIMVFEPC